jgi:hypothetical protein
MAEPRYYRAFIIVKREGKEDFWLNVGRTFDHADGEGYNLLLQALPIDGKLVLRLAKEGEPEEEKEERPKPKSANKK